MAGGALNNNTLLDGVMLAITSAQQRCSLALREPGCIADGLIDTTTRSWSPGAGQGRQLQQPPPPPLPSCPPAAPALPAPRLSGGQGHVRQCDARLELRGVGGWGCLGEHPHAALADLGRHGGLVGQLLCFWGTMRGQGEGP